MERNKWAQRMGAVIAQAECLMGGEETVGRLLDSLLDLRIDSLEPAELKVYQWIEELDAPVTAAEVAYAFEIKANHASGLLKALTAYGLLDRRRETNYNGQRYIYTLHRMT